jgi:hypothetical protein
MIKPDFSDFHKGGYRIQEFRLIHTPEMRSPKYNKAMKECKSTRDIIREKQLIIKHLIEKNEIDFTIYYFSVRLMYAFITATLLLFISRNTILALPIISASLSLVFYILANRHKENFALGSIGITLVESLYTARIKEIYNI